MTTCAICDQKIKPCAPCCRHTGWVHKESSDHHSDKPRHHYARPKSNAIILTSRFLTWCPNIGTNVLEELK